MSLTSLLLGMYDESEDTVRENYIKLPFSYPGSKSEQVDQILPYLPQRSAYGEPFGGTGAVLLNRNPSKLEVFNDRYAGITAFFRVIRDPVLFPLFMERISCTVHSREEFIWCKKTWKDHEDEVERAARWYYMARFAVGGKMNSTFGRAINPAVKFANRLHVSLPLFEPIHRRLHGVQIENMDWRMILQDYDQEDMVWYLDPTYLDSSPGTYEHELSLVDHQELANRIPHLKGFVAMSSYDGPQTRAIYEKCGWDDCIRWERVSRASTQGVHENIKTFDKVKELLWIRHSH